MARYMMGTPLRFYTNPLKLLLLFLASISFVLMGLVLIHTGRIDRVIIGWAGIIFFGFCSLIISLMILRSRQPLITVDAQGWHIRVSLFTPAQFVSWQDIARLAIHRKKMSRNTTYWLVLQAKYPERLPGSRLRSLNAALFPRTQTAIGRTPLNQLFLYTTPEKCLHLLDQIVSAYGSELQQNSIQVQRTIYPL